MIKENKNDIARYQLDGLTVKKLEQCFNKNRTEPCFLGIWRKYEWLDLLNLMTFENRNIDTLIFSDFTSNPRGSITWALREKVWGKINNRDIGKCYACEDVLEFKLMECAHIKAHSFGGKTTLENLMPTCKKCNRDCGVMNLLEYKKLITIDK